MIRLPSLGRLSRREAKLPRGGHAIESAAGLRNLEQLVQLRWIAATGVDRISIGRLTKDVKAVDYSMRIDGPAAG